MLIISIAGVFFLLALVFHLIVAFKGQSQHMQLNALADAFFVIAVAICLLSRIEIR